jgi:hypothetical protein
MHRFVLVVVSLAATFLLGSSQPVVAQAAGGCSKRALARPAALHLGLQPGMTESLLMTATFPTLSGCDGKGVRVVSMAFETRNAKRRPAWAVASGGPGATPHATNRRWQTTVVEHSTVCHNERFRADWRIRTRVNLTWRSHSGHPIRRTRYGAPQRLCQDSHVNPNLR